ncbi:MAG: DUF4097 domain-containing protein [Clostridiales bacterium]|nr:DUF4097 domain-containing protein [Clostridiales bacterium]
MKNTLFIIGASLIILGGIIFVGFMAYNNWNFSKLWENKYQDKTEEITVDFSDILVTTDTSDITFVKSENGKTEIFLREKKNKPHNVKVENGTLKIELCDERAWYEKIFDFGSAKIKISLPNDIYQNLNVKSSTGDVALSKELTFNDISIIGKTGDVNLSSSALGKITINLSTGDIDVKNTTCEDVELTLSTGDVEISSLTAKNLNVSLSTGDVDIDNAFLESLTLKTTTGDVELEKVVANGKIKIITDTGDVDFSRCDGAELEIETDTGDVEGSLLSSKIFIVDTDTGRKRVPETTSGGIAKITTDTGDIIINIVN